MNIQYTRGGKGNVGIYKDVELSIKHIADIIHEPLSLDPRWHITHTTSYSEPHPSPTLQAPIKLRFIPRTRMHCSTQAQQFLHNRMPKFAPNSKIKLGFSNDIHQAQYTYMQKKREREREIKETQFHECHRWQELSFPGETIEGVLEYWWWGLGCLHPLPL